MEPAARVSSGAVFGSLIPKSLVSFGSQPYHTGLVSYTLTLFACLCLQILLYLQPVLPASQLDKGLATTSECLAV